MSLISPCWSQCRFKVNVPSANRTTLTALVADVLGADACCAQQVRQFSIWVEFGAS